MIPPLHSAISFLPAGFATRREYHPFVVIVRTPEELGHWLDDSSPELQWIQVEGLLSDSAAWAAAAHSAADTPLDVVLSNPEAEFTGLYRLVDVRASREVRVTIPVVPGFLKALRLAASLGLAVRLLPGQPSPEVLREFARALEFYLHYPMVDAPIEPFHSLLAGNHGMNTGSLWVILEEEPAMFMPYGADGFPLLSRSSHPAVDEASVARYVEEHIARVVEDGGECATCPWWQSCSGYFKLPDRAYSCGGVKKLFSHIAEAAGEFERDLMEYESSGKPRLDSV